MTLIEITPAYSVAPQIGTGDVAEIAAKGFRSIICNRPDGETPTRPTSRKSAPKPNASASASLSSR